MCRRYKFWQIFLLQFKRTMLYYSPKDFILLSKIQIVVLQYVEYPYKIYAVIMPYFSAYLLMQNGVLRMFLPSSNNSVAGFLIQFEYFFQFSPYIICFPAIFNLQSSSVIVKDNIPSTVNPVSENIIISMVKEIAFARPMPRLKTH